MLQAGELAEMLPTALAGVVPDPWTQAFYCGRSHAMEAMYREHFGTVRAAVFGVVRGADGETVIHEVFLRLISHEELRRAYRAEAGTFSSWLYTLARNHAVDYARRRARETPTGLSPADDSPGDQRTPSTLPQQIEARALVRRFREQVLPAKWVSVFDARFVSELDQREAARSLGIPRTTLVYREHRIRCLLRAFLRSGEEA